MAMDWLPFDDDIAKSSENLILKYNPNFLVCREKRPHTFNSFIV